jgi:hypothetical protein
MARDYYRIVYARDSVAAREAYQAFLRKARRRCTAVARSLEIVAEHSNR